MTQIMPEITQERKTFFNSELQKKLHFFTRSLVLPHWGEDG